MFTGLITATGTLLRATPAAGGLELVIAAPWTDLTLGESIAVDGACLTVTNVGIEEFTVHVVVTSLERTLFGTISPGQRVNLERALRVGDRLGGHMVQGHVDGVGEVLQVVRRADGWLVDVEVPATVASVSIPLGSITVNGVSLTVNALPSPGMIQLSVIPFTLQHTTLHDLQPGSRVHLEGDMVGKYLKHFMITSATQRGS